MQPVDTIGNCGENESSGKQFEFICHRPIGIRLQLKDTSVQQFTPSSFCLHTSQHWKSTQVYLHSGEKEISKRQLSGHDAYDYGPMAQSKPKLITRLLLKSSAILPTFRQTPRKRHASHGWYKWVSQSSQLHRQQESIGNAFWRNRKCEAYAGRLTVCSISLNIPSPRVI